jgi:hypothetical protein
MLQQVQGLKDIDSAIILVALPPSASRRPRKALKTDPQEIFDNRLDNESMYGQKVSIW